MCKYFLDRWKGRTKWQVVFSNQRKCILDRKIGETEREIEREREREREKKKER